MTEMEVHGKETLERENAKLQHKLGLFDAVRQRLDQKTVERNAPDGIELLTHATVSPEPYKDHRVLYTVVVLVLSGIGFFLANWQLRKRKTT